MTPAERRRVLRLTRLEKIRAISRQAAAREAAEAESTLAQLEALALRTGDLVSAYGVRSDTSDGAALHRLSAFREGLRGVSHSTHADAGRARALADDKLTQLAEAERRRQAVGDRLTREVRAQGQLTSETATGRRSGNWHGS